MRWSSTAGGRRAAFRCGGAGRAGRPRVPRPAEGHVDPSATGLLPEKFARRYSALPVLFLDDTTVLVAVADPTDVVSADDLRLAIGLDVKLAVVEREDLEETIGHAYRGQVEIVETQTTMNWRRVGRAAGRGRPRRRRDNRAGDRLVNQAARARDRRRRLRHPLRAAANASWSSARASTASCARHGDPEGDAGGGDRRA